MSNMDNFKKYINNLFSQTPNSYKEFIGDIINGSRYESYSNKSFVESINEYAEWIYNCQDYFNFEISRKFISEIKKKDYYNAFLTVLHEWKHSFIECSIKWDKYPKELSRSILIPLRNTIADLIYAILASLRADCFIIPRLTSCGSTFVLPLEDFIEDEDKDDNTYPANNNTIVSLYLNTINNKFEVELLPYEHNLICSFKKPQYILDDKYPYNIIVNKAKGYGLYELDMDSLIEYIEEFKQSGNINKDIIAIDFFNTNTKELKEMAEGYYIYAFTKYEISDELYDNEIDIKHLIS